MNSAHFHLMFTHLPLVGLGFAIITNLFALYWKSNDVKKFSLWVYVIVGVGALLAYFTGDGSEEVMTTYPGITEQLIEPHEQVALWFLIGLLVLSAAALAGLYLSKPGKINLQKLTLITLFAAMILSVVAVQTASSGGKIRHTEIEQGTYKVPIK